MNSSKIHTKSTGITCVIDGEDIAFCSDVGVLLSMVDTQDAVSEIVKDVCLNHHARFGYGTDYLMLFIHYLKISASHLLDQGVPVQYIILYMREAVDLCIANLDKWSIPIDVQSFSLLDLHDGSHVGSSTTSKTFGSVPTDSSYSVSKPKANLDSTNETSLTTGTPDADSFHFDVCPLADRCWQSNDSCKTKSKCLQTNQTLGAERNSKCLNQVEPNIDFSLVDWNNDFLEVEFENPAGTCDVLSKNSDIPSLSGKNGKDQSFCDYVDCEPVFLKMADKEQDSEEADDVAWFFDNSIDSTNCVTQNNSQFLKFDASNLCERVNKAILEHNNDKPSSSKLKSKTHIGTKKDGIVFEDLEDDFDYIFTCDEMTSFKIENPPNGNSKSVKNDKNRKYLEDLFQNLPGSKTKQQPSKILSRHLTNDDVSKLTVSETEDKLTKKINHKKVKPKADIDSENNEKRNKINSILENFSSKQSPKTLASKVLNSSRHFKTFSTSEPRIVLKGDDLFCVEQNPVTQNSDTQDTVITQNSEIVQKHVITQNSETAQDTVNTQNTETAQEDFTTQETGINQYLVTTQISVTTQQSVKAQNSSLTTYEQEFTKIPSFIIDLKTKKNLTIKDVSAGLHGNKMVKEIVLESFKSQVTFDSSEVHRYDVRRIHTVIEKGPSPCFTRLISGLVLNCSIYCVVLLTQLKRINAILLNGDLTCSFHHKGYKANYKGANISKSVAMETVEDKWISQLLLVLLKLEVNTVLVKGHTSSKVRDSLESNNILLIELVPYRILQALSESTGTIPLIYPLDAFEGNVCKDIRITEYNDNYLYTRSETTSRCIIHHAQSVLQTVIICHPCQLGAEVMLQDFWQCANQLKDAVADRMVLPGSGKVEELCVRLLHQSTQRAYEFLDTSKEDKSYFKHFVFEEMGNIFENLTTQLKEKFETEIYDFDSTDGGFHSKECSLKPKYDHYRCKAQTWKKALETIVDILRTDCVITTGGTEDNDFASNIKPHFFYTFQNKPFI